MTSIRVLSLRTVLRNQRDQTRRVRGGARLARHRVAVDRRRVAGCAGGGYTRRAANCAVPIDIGSPDDRHWRSPTGTGTGPYRRNWFGPGPAPSGRAHLPGRIENSSAGTDSGDRAGHGRDQHRRGDSVEPTAGSGVARCAWTATSPADHAMAAAVISSVRNGWLVFAGIRDDERLLVAIGRGAITLTAAGNPVLSVTALHTLSGHRGRGLGGQVLAALLGWGRDLGAGTAYLQVDAANRAAGARCRRDSRLQPAPPVRVRPAVAARRHGLPLS